MNNNNKSNTVVANVSNKTISYPKSYSKYSSYKSTKLPFKKLDNKLPIDWELYKTLLFNQSPSGTIHEDKFAEFLVDWMTTNIDPALDITTDKIGNLYVKKGEADLYPCVVAHMDINQDYCNDMKIVKTDDWVLAYDNSTGLQIGPGHDDKSGVYLCLEMLRLLPNVKVAFFTQEEIGCVGSHAAYIPFFHDCTMIIQQDRNAYAGPELITYTNGIDICSVAFVKAASALMTKYEYIESSGTCTDVGALKANKDIDCIALNLCAAYYDEHTSEEVLSVRGFENCINFAYELLTTLGNTKWEHVAEKIPYSYYPQDSYSAYKSSGLNDLKEYYLNGVCYTEGNKDFKLDEYYNYKDAFYTSEKSKPKKDTDYYENDYMLDSEETLYLEVDGVEYEAVPLDNDVYIYHETTLLGIMRDCSTECLTRDQRYMLENHIEEWITNKLQSYVG